MGMRSASVKELQMYLNSNGYTVATSGAGSVGSESTYFGAKTKAAVQAFQSAKGISPVSGFVGPLTRAVLNSGSTTPGTPTPTAGQITVSAASDTPANIILATGSSMNKILKLNIANGSSASVNVTQLNLTKTGFLANTNVSGISVYDANGVQHGYTVTSLGANGVATMTFGSNPITVAAGQTMAVWVKVNLCLYSGCTGSTQYTGTIGFSVNAATDVVLSAGTASGAFPVMGAQLQIVNGSNSLAAVTADVMAVNTGGVTLNVDPTAEQEISKFKIAETSSNEDVMLYGLKLWNNGNANQADYSDVQLLDPTDAVISTAQPNGQVVDLQLPTGFLIKKGETKNFKVRAKIIGGSTRTIQFTLYNDYDVNVRGVSTGANLLPTAAGGVDSTFPVGDTTSTYNKVTVGQGSIVFSRGADSSSAGVVPGANDVVLASYDVKPIGENVELRSISFGLDQDTSAVALTGTVYVRVDGAIVYSAAANTTNFPVVGTASTKTLSTYPVLSSGVVHKLEVLVSISSSATSSDAYFVNDMDIISVKRLISNDITDPTVASQDGLTRNVKAAALVVTTLGTPIAGSVVPGTNSAEFANVEFNAGASGEDVRVSAITVTDTKGGSAVYTDLTNLVMKDASGNTLTTTSSTATNANTVAFNLTNPIIVSRTAPVIVKLYADVLSSATAGTTTAHAHTYNVASSGVTATGKDTGNSIASPTYAGNGQAQTIVSGGTLTMSNVAGSGGSPANTQIVKVGTADQILMAFKWSAQYESQKITTLKLKATGTSLATVTDLSNIRLYAQQGTGALLSGTNTFASANQLVSCSGNTCYYTWTATDNLLPFTINPGTPVTVFVKADISAGGVAKLGEDFYLNVTNDGTDVVAKGSATGTAPTYAGSANLSGAASFIVPCQVVVTGDAPSNGSTQLSSIGAGTQIARFKVTNNCGGQVTLTTAKFTDSGTHTGTAARYTIYSSSEGSSDYTANTLATSSADFSSGVLSFTVSQTINGGSFRFITLAITTVTSVAAGDTFNMSVAALGDWKFSATEANLGFDGTLDGDQGDTVSSLYVDGKPALGFYQKQ
jgi:hypothetical protein